MALEGTCFTGKTTLAHALAKRLGVPVMPEYADLAPLPPFPPAHQDDVAAALDHLLTVEWQRAELARATTPRLVVLDRSPLSCITFQYAVAALGVPCDHRLFAARFATAADHGQAIPPVGYLYLQIDPDLAHQRQARRGPVMPCLMDPRVLDRLHHADTQFLYALPPQQRLVLNGGRHLDELVEEAAAFVTATSGQLDRDAAAAWRRLPDLLQHAGTGT